MLRDDSVYLEHMLEAARNVSDTARSSHPEIPRREAVGMRNVIVHDYLGVDESIVRTVALQDLPPLIEALERGLGRA